MHYLSPMINVCNSGINVYTAFSIQMFDPLATILGRLCSLLKSLLRAETDSNTFHWRKYIPLVLKQIQIHSTGANTFHWR